MLDVSVWPRFHAGAFAGGYRADAEDPAEASASGEPLWELALAARHYHPHVATAAQSIAQIPPDGALPMAGATLDSSPDTYDARKLADGLQD